ncbi:VOC family protein [Actinoplanes sp. NPDC049596]|uniref:VOC family protein n=1 Tax=unclassified Actinoplanes TaxID=2626549 RepID=UPI0034157E96
MDVFLDRPAGTLDAAVSFWAEVTGSEPKAQRDPGFVRLGTAAGDDWVEIQEVRSGEGGTHPDLWVDDPAGFTGRVLTAGAGLVCDHGDWVTLRSPGGLAFCVARWRDQSVRPRPFAGPGGVTTRPHQICIDVGPSSFEDEVRFWEIATGWRLDSGELGEFRRLQPEPPIPVRFLLQRLGEERPISAHLDVTCSDRPAGRAWHESLGATFVGEWPHWTTLRDPAGGVYCLTEGDPATD